MNVFFCFHIGRSCLKRSFQFFKLIFNSGKPMVFIYDFSSSRGKSALLIPTTNLHYRKYIIFDLFDYTYFNYDVLLSNECLDYLAFNGFFLENRNSNCQKRFNNNINQILTDLFNSRTDTSALAKFQSIFPSIHCPDIAKYQLEYKNRFCKKTVLNNENIQAYSSPKASIFSSIQRHIFEPTIQFQISNLERFFQLLSRINPDIKVIGVLLPKYLSWKKMKRL